MAIQDILQADVAFATALYTAAEAEARQTERYLLIALGAMYAYLTTKDIPQSLQKIAWYVPAIVTAFTGLRALGLGLRQHDLLKFLACMKGGQSQFAIAFLSGPSYLAYTIGAFYITLFAASLAVALRVTGRLKGPP